MLAEIIESLAIAQRGGPQFTYLPCPKPAPHEQEKQSKIQECDIIKKKHTHKILRTRGHNGKKVQNKLRRTEKKRNIFLRIVLSKQKTEL